MSHTTDTIHPTDTITVDDIRAVLAVTSTDLGTLCSHPRINPWSIAKPVRLAVNFTPGYTNQGRQWWQADGACGFDIPYTNTYPTDGSKPTDLIDICTTGWQYQRPTGDAQSPYRYDDFRGYYHKATAPFTRLFLTEKAAKGQTIQIAMSLGITTDATTPPGSLSLKHITHPYLSGNKPLADYYLGVLITDRDGRRKYIGTTDTHDTATHITIPDSWPLDTYNVYPFLSSLKIDPEDGPISEGGTPLILIPVPGIKDLPAQFEITDKEEALGYDITIDATSSSLMGIVSVSIRISPPATLTNPQIKNCTVAYIKNGATIATQTIANPTFNTPIKTSYNYDKNNGGVAPDKVIVHLTVSHPNGINDTTIEKQQDIRLTINSGGTLTPEKPTTPTT